MIIKNISFNKCRVNSVQYDKNQNSLRKVNNTGKDVFVSEPSFQASNPKSIDIFQAGLDYFNNNQFKNAYKSLGSALYQREEALKAGIIPSLEKADAVFTELYAESVFRSGKWSCTNDQRFIATQKLSLPYEYYLKDQQYLSAARVKINQAMYRAVSNPRKLMSWADHALSCEDLNIAKELLRKPIPEGYEKAADYTESMFRIAEGGLSGIKETKIKKKNDSYIGYARFFGNLIGGSF